MKEESSQRTQTRIERETTRWWRRTFYSSKRSM